MNADTAQAPPARLTAYLQRRRLPGGARRGREVLVELNEPSDRHLLQASFCPVGPSGAFLLVGVRSSQWVSSDARQQVLASCNVWNSRMRLPRAWFDESPEEGAGQVVLDGCAPFAAVRTQPQFDALADAVIAGARRFWGWVDVHASW